MSTYLAEITGTTPLVQDAEQEKVDGWIVPPKPTTKRAIAPRDMAERLCFRDSEGCLIHPARSVVAAIGAELPGALRSVRPVDDWLLLFGPDGLRLRTFEVHQGTKIRPRFSGWSASVRLEIRHGKDAGKVFEALQHAGEWVGIGAIRRDNYGRFTASWHDIEAGG